jgi:CDP-paratose 2-epimerase
VYILGGGRENITSMLEAIERIEQMTRSKLDCRYVEKPRKGDHICYISNPGKFKKDYPGWKITRGLDAILEEIIASQQEQLKEIAGK